MAGSLAAFDRSDDEPKAAGSNGAAHKRGEDVYPRKAGLKGPGMAIRPQPARNATSPGPKSRARLTPVWVNGAVTDINAATVAPMKTGPGHHSGGPRYALQ